MMKRLFLLLCLLLPSLVVDAGEYRIDQIPNVQLRDPARFVSNPDGILSAEAVAHIDSVCASLRQRGLAQVAVVAVEEIAGDDVFTFAMDLFGQWGVGSAKNSNGLGVLLVRDRHEIRFVTGGGVEGILPDAICKRIQMRYMLPDFRNEDYDRGMVAGMDATAEVLAGNDAVLEGDSDEELPTWMIFVIVVGFMVLPLALVMIVYYANHRCPRCHALALHQQSQQVVKLTTAYKLIEYTYVCSKCGKEVKRQAKSLLDDHLGGGSGGGTIIGGFGGGSFGGSGGGSWGGGSFGGGGAGSKW